LEVVAVVRSPIYDFEETDDLEQLKQHRIYGWKLYKELLPAQPPETRAGLTQADIAAQLNDADKYLTPNWSLDDLIYLDMRDTGKTREQILDDWGRRNVDANSLAAQWIAEYERREGGDDVGEQ
jgi:hypothetical protein